MDSASQSKIAHAIYFIVISLIVNPILRNQLSLFLTFPYGDDYREETY